MQLIVFFVKFINRNDKTLNHGDVQFFCLDNIFQISCSINKGKMMHLVEFFSNNMMFGAIDVGDEPVQSLVAGYVPCGELTSKGVDGP